MRFQLAARSKGIRQADLANLCEVSLSSMCNWVAAKRPIPTRHICTLASHLDIPIDIMIQENELVRIATQKVRRAKPEQTGQTDPFLIYPRRKVEMVIETLEEPINDALLRILGIEMAHDALESYRLDLRRWLNRISRLRIDQRNRQHAPPAPKTFWTILYDRPFGERALNNVRCAFSLLAEEGAIRNPLSDEDVVQRVGNFYTEAVHCLVKGNPGEHLVQLL